MPKYEHKKIEKKWKREWEKMEIYKTKESSDKPKYYVLDMFPYPSGAGLHVGHPKGYIATDVVARMKMMQGFNVLHPMGWDAFGLPAENYAIANKVHPSEATAKNIKTFKKQLGLLGFTYDWDREVNTTDPKYYKWTQWAFLQMFKKGLAFESNEPINWCPRCETGLANEDLDDGKCERCGTPVERKPMRQWVLKITKYADRLLNDLDKLKEWPEPIKEMQRNWIGRSEGAEINFSVIPVKTGIQAPGFPIMSGMTIEEKVKVFTTRPDTIFGATYLVVAPEHSLIKNFKLKIENYSEVEQYVVGARNKSDLERTDLSKEKTGVELKGLKAINPATNEELPIYVADYVITGYGTGAIMAVPAHDERDWEFAKKYSLSIKKVVKSNNQKECFIGEGVVVNSDFLDGLSTSEAKKKIINWLEEKGIGTKKVQYKLRDWVFSRQRYWGEPIPLVHCENCQNKKQKVLIVHGLTGRADKNWMPFMKKKLEDIGFEVIIPTMTTSEHPVMEKWLDELSPIVNDFDENDVVIGHSIGCSAVLQLISRLNKNIGHVYLVAPAVGGLTDEDLQDKKTKKSEKDYDSAKIFWDWPIEWSKILNKVKHVAILYSNNDPSVRPLGRDFWPADWDIRFLGNFEHFTKVGFEDLFDNFQQSRLTGWIPVPENELPLELPKVKNYAPSGTGESPLANIHDWVNTKCPVCGGKATRETNTMPQWAGSCWYYLAYAMLGNQNVKIKNQKYDWRQEKIDYWNPVDLYVGGAEHATRHLIYARFWHKFLYDIGKVKNDEPFTRLQNVGLILAEDGRKMSKRWNNVINPDDVVEKFGADAMRVYEMFLGPFDQPCAWSTQGLVGAKRFLEKVWALREKVTQIVILNEMKDPLKQTSRDSSVVALPQNDSKKLTVLSHQTIKKVSDDIEKMRFNTAISQLMILANEMNKEEKIALENYFVFLKLLSPFAPHIAEELWNVLGNKESIFLSEWPKYDADFAKYSEITLVVQVNGKVRDTTVVHSEISEEEAKKIAVSSENIQKWLDGKIPKKIIYVKGKLVSIVV